MPAKTEKKNLIWVTLSNEERQRVRVAAAHLGEPMSKFAVRAVLEAAENTLRKVKKSAE